MFCPKCGMENAEGSRFCNKCGFAFFQKVENRDVSRDKRLYYFLGGGGLIIAILVLLAVLQNAVELLNNEVESTQRTTGIGNYTYGDSSYRNSYQETVSEKDFEIREYRGDRNYYLIIKNNGTATVNIEGNLITYDAKGNAIGAESASLRRLGSQEEAVMDFLVFGLSEADHVDYTLSYKAATGYDSLYQGLELTKQRNLKNVILTIKNISNESKTVWAVEGYFFDGKGNLVDTDTEYISGEIAAGSSYSVELNSYQSYDHVECYLKALF